MVVTRRAESLAAAKSPKAPVQSPKTRAKRQPRASTSNVSVEPIEIIESITSDDDVSVVEEKSSTVSNSSRKESESGKLGVSNPLVEQVYFLF